MSKKLRIVENPADANWKCRNCGVFVQFKAPENNLAALPPGLGKCPRCKKPGSLIRHDPLHPNDDETIKCDCGERPATWQGIPTKQLAEEYPGETWCFCDECMQDLISGTWSGGPFGSDFITFISLENRPIEERHVPAGLLKEGYVDSYIIGLSDTINELRRDLMLAKQKLDATQDDLTEHLVKLIRCIRMMMKRFRKRWP